MEAWKPIVLRDVLRRIAGRINKFKEVGNNAVYHDPVHAAVPWAAVRFVHQIRIRAAFGAS